AAGVCGEDDEHARFVVDDPAVTENVAVNCVPTTAAVIVTVPGEEPNVTIAFAWPDESVDVVPGETLAAPDVTVKVTPAPATPTPVDDVTWTISGCVSV